MQNPNSMAMDIEEEEKRPTPFFFNPEKPKNYQNPQIYQNYQSPPFLFQIPPPDKRKKPIFDFEMNNRPPFYPLLEGVPKENQPFFFNQVERKPAEPLVLCEICNKNVIYSKFGAHMTTNHPSFSRNPQRVEFRMNGGVQRGRSAHNIPKDFEPILQERGPHMRMHPQIFNERGLREIRNMEIPHHMQMVRMREDQHRRPHNERKKKKKFEQKDIDYLFPLVKFQEEKGRSLDEEANKCSICLGDFSDGEYVRYLTCLHRFHQDCVDAWLVKNIVCPVCKKDLVKLVQLGEEISRK